MLPLGGYSPQACQETRRVFLVPRQVLKNGKHVVSTFVPRLSMCCLSLGWCTIMKEAEQESVLLLYKGLLGRV